VVNSGIPMAASGEISTSLSTHVENFAKEVQI
jgi:hypothetical protein